RSSRRALLSYTLSASRRQPSGSSLRAIFGPCIEGNRRAWCGPMNSVDDGFEYCKAPGRQAHARSDYDTIVARRSQLTLGRRPSGFIGVNEAHIAFPTPCSKLLERNRNACANLLDGHTRWQSGVGEIHSLRIVANEQNPRHEPSSFASACTGQIRM